MTSPSGIDERTGEWTPKFAGQRRPFPPGHELSTRHGSYALLQLRPRADEIAGQLREAMDSSYESRFEGAIGGAAMTAAQLERAMAALCDATDASQLARLDQDARGWMSLWFKALGTLGLTPASASRLGLLAGAGAPSLVLVMQGEKQKDGES